MFTTVSSAIVLAVFASHVEAHGYLEEPTPSWTSGSANPEWVVLIDNYWDIGSGGDQCGLFKTMAEEKNVTVRDVVLDMVGEDKKCGYTDDSATPQPVPTDGMAKWLGNGGGGFTHVGPCEIYIDDTMVLHGDNCEDEYPGGDVGSTVTSDMPVDYSSCNGDCTLTIYWLAFQNAQWQAYINCVPLTGSGSTTQTSTETGSEATSTETEAPVTETGSTAASSTGTEAPTTETLTTETPVSDAPVATTQTTEAPSTTMETPTTETKCNASARRLRKKTTTE